VGVVLLERQDNKYLTKIYDWLMSINKIELPDNKEKQIGNKKIIVYSSKKPKAISNDTAIVFKIN
jgi:hypothetical protein